MAGEFAEPWMPDQVRHDGWVVARAYLSAIEGRRRRSIWPDNSAPN